MIKIIIWSIISIVALILLGNPKLTFKPFSFKLEEPLLILAYFFLIISISTFQYNSYRKGYRKGYRESTNDTIEILQQEAKKYKDDKPRI